jgi:hypothetical protein
MFLANLIERLAEMFPRQDYSARLDRYVAAQKPTSLSEIEHWQNQFDQHEFNRIA